MTEIPEHLLARSKARRAALTGEGDAGESAAPATTESAAPAESASAAAAPAAAATPAPVEKAPEPTPPWVEAAESRRRVPFWAVPALALLLPFAIVYALTLDEPTDENSPLALGTEVYAASGCAGCHGGGGGGGVGPAFTDGALIETFPSPVDQVTWVALGTTGFQELGIETYGATDKPVGGGGNMPAQQGSLEPAEIMEVILHERVDLAGEEFDIEVWREGFEEGVAELLPDEADAYVEVLDEWEADPPV